LSDLLPKKKKKPNLTIGKACLLIYGANGAGKSTLCANAPNALFLETEPGADHLERFSKRCTGLNDIIAIYKELAKGEDKFSPIVIDTVDKLYDQIKESLCREKQVESPAEIPHGAGWAQINSRLEALISRFQALGRGLWLMGHAKKDDKGYTIPQLSAGASDRVCNMVDVIGYISVDEEGKRRVHFSPGRGYKAKARVKQGNTMPDTDLDYDQIVKAFEKAQK